MNDAVIAKLAWYFTGPDVAEHSINMAVGGRRMEVAKRFFAVRDALGIRGYPKADAAVQTIVNALEKP